MSVPYKGLTLPDTNDPSASNDPSIQNWMKDLLNGTSSEETRILLDLYVDNGGFDCEDIMNNFMLENSTTNPATGEIDLNYDDLIIEVKKLKKSSSFNIDSCTGSAGIRGWVEQVLPAGSSLAGEAIDAFDEYDSTV
jgi:hypothetical protein